MADTDALVRDLRSFRTRKQAMSELIEKGEDAVDALIDALGSAYEGVPWAAVRCLGMIGSEKAIEPLIDCVGKSHLRDSACWALSRITGKNFGQDAAAWKRWFIGGEEKGVSPESGPDLEDTTLLREALRGLDAETKISGKSCLIRLRLDPARQQTVRVVLGAADMDQCPIALVYSECGPADPKHYEYALKTNITLPYGALAIRSVDGEDRLVMFNSLLRQGLTPLALRKSIVTIGERADKVEKRLAGHGRQ